MGQESPRFWEVFFEVYEALPRQGPGDRASTERAVHLCRDLPAAPAVLDMGCGTGAQSLDLADILPGVVVALDRHAPFLSRLATSGVGRARRGVVMPLVGDMGAPPFPAGTFDLVHSEGALYFLGVEEALKLCRTLLRPRGFVTFSEAVWRRPGAPEELRAVWEREYPRMTDVVGNFSIIGRCGFEVLGHFTLPDDAWWTDFYAPMERRLGELRPRYEADAQASEALEWIGREIAMHRRYGGWYGYEFFAVRRTD